MIIRGAEPFFLPGGPVGCLLVHGFTGTPKEMRWLGEFLNEKGYSVLGVRLAGHATQVQDMIRTHWQDWLASIEDGYDLLSGTAQNIFIAGLSLGGILSLTFASGKFTPQCPVAGVIGMAVPQALPINPLLQSAIKPYSLVNPYLAPSESDWHDHQAEHDHICYERGPVRGFAEVRDLLTIMNPVLPQIQVPALLIYSKDDQVVRPEAQHAEKIFAAIGSKEKQLVWVEGSGHNLTRDAKRMEVFKHIADFIGQEIRLPA